MIPCRCQITCHDYDCPNHMSQRMTTETYTQVKQYAQSNIDTAFRAGHAEGYQRGVKDMLAEIPRREGYGSATITDCPKCGKPDVHWSVSSHLSCRDCQRDQRLIAAQDRIHELEKLSEMLLTMSNPFCGRCGKRPDPEGPLCSYSWQEARWFCVECARG